MPSTTPGMTRRRYKSIRGATAPGLIRMNPSISIDQAERAGARAPPAIEEAPRGDQRLARDRAAARVGASDALVSHIHFSNSPSRSRGAFSAPGFLFLRFTHPNRGVAERRETYGCSDTLGLHVTRQARHLPGRLPSHNGRRAPPGALTLALSASAPAVPSPA